MAPRKKKDPPIINHEEIICKPMEEVMHDSMIPYSEHVILERALPRVEDGLKPVQRRILFTMHELGNTPDKPHRKCARIVGDCLGKYHPHGDSSVYDALTRMAQDFVMRGMLVDGHGNFGSIDGDSPAAMRYTEARMTELTTVMLKDIEKDTVGFHLNFDDTQKEPDLLPARFPNLLVNGASGIAVGLATNIPPHNLGETIDATIALIDDPKMTTGELMKYLPAPDFPTGGILACDGELISAYETGRGKLQVRAAVHIEDGTAGRKLIVMDEMPYQVNKAALLTKILRLREEKKTLLGGIYDIRDESDRTGMRAVVELKKDVDVDRVLNALYKYSDMQVTFGVNMVAIADGKPVQMGLKQALTYYIRHQKEVTERRTRYDLAQAEARAHVLEGLIIAVDNLDEVIRIIRSSKTPKEARERLMERFELTQIQAQAILDMRLQRLTNLEVLSLKNEYAEICKKIAEYKAILKSEKKLMGVIKKELKEVREKFADPRRTKLVNAFDAIVIREETAPAEETMVIFTREGFMKRMQDKAYEKAITGGDFTDMPTSVLKCLTTDKLLFFTNMGNCYPLAAEQIPEGRAKERGKAAGALLAGLENDEVVVGILNSSTAKEAVLATANGLIKRTVMEDLIVRKSRYAAITLKGDDQLICALDAASGTEVQLVTAGGMTIHFGIDEVSVIGRTAAGVKSMALAAGDKIISAFLHNNEGEIVIATDMGYLKRCLLIDFDKQARGGKGDKCIAMTKTGTNGKCVVGVLPVTDPFNFQIVHKSGTVIEVNTEDVMIEKKNGKGQLFTVVVLGDTVAALRK